MIRHLALLNLATLLFSLIGVLVKTIPLPTGQVVFGRALSGLAVILIVLAIQGQNPLKLRRGRDLWGMLAVGLLLSGNWFFYFKSIQISSVAVAVISLFTYPLITALVEPLVFGERYRWVDVVGAVLVIVGVALVVPEFSLQNATTLGVVYGIIAAASISLCNIFSRKIVAGCPTLVMMAYQFAVAAVIFSAFWFVDPPALDAPTAGKLVLLGAGLTAAAFLLFFHSLRHFSTSTASVIVSLQPLETVLLAWLLLGDRPAASTLTGGAIITATVLMVMLYHAWDRSRKIAVPTPAPGAEAAAADSTLTGASRLG